jgi:hypothetical protein
MIRCPNNRWFDGPIEFLSVEAAILPLPASAAFM